MRRANQLLLIILAASLLSACSGAGQTPPTQENPMPTLPPESPFRVVGYATSAVVVSTIQFDKITHLNYAFLIPQADGTFTALPNEWKLEQIVERAHQNGVQVLISVGGWGWDAEFETLAADPQARAVFVRDLTALVERLNLDGADIDWEFPDAGASSQNFLALMGELRSAMPDKLLTMAVVALGANGEGVPNETFELVDFVNIMAYDGEGENHSSMEYARQALDYWLGRGLPPEMAVLGVPFYAHPNGVAYQKILQADTAAAQLDFFDYYGVMLNYNGIPTMQEKTRLAMQRASGVMIWTLEHDSTDEFSLLAAIHRVVAGEE